MNVLVLALYAEGPTDHDFLPSVIQRTAEQILFRYDQTNIEVLRPISLKKDPEISNWHKGILQAARDVESFDALIIHSDADNRTYQQTRFYRFEPGLKLVQECKEKVCKKLLPIIPVREIEAWMLADYEKLREVVGTDLSVQDLGLSEKAKQVESYRDPKRMLEQIVKKVYPSRPHQWSRILGELYGQLAPEISLNRLKEVPAYKQFVDDLTQTLRALSVISRNP